MIETTLSRIRVAALCLPLALVASCGSSGTEAVQGTTVVISPQAIGVPVTESLGSALVAQLYDIQLRSPSGGAQIDVQMTIDSDGTVYEVDKSTTPFTLILRNPPYLTTTGSTGVETVAVDFAVPAAFSGEITVLEVYSGTAYGRTNVVVTCTDSDSTTPPACP